MATPANRVLWGLVKLMERKLAGMPVAIQAPQAGRGFVQIGFYGTQRLSSQAFGYIGVAAEARRGWCSEAGHLRAAGCVNQRCLPASQPTLPIARSATSTASGSSAVAMVSFQRLR